MAAAPYTQLKIIAYSLLLADSFEHWTGEPLVREHDIPRALFEAPFPVVSHGTQADPIFRYANRAALDLWETDWESFTRMPSRQSAEPITDIQDDRQRLLAEAMKEGCVSDYNGVRISATGKRFLITDTILWNVIDMHGVVHGQAARIGRVLPPDARLL